jgi:hypothetical protein
VAWEGWSFHIGFSWREGLILNNIQLQGRPVLYRAALAEVRAAGVLSLQYVHVCARCVFCLVGLEADCVYFAASCVAKACQFLTAAAKLPALPADHCALWGAPG